MKVAFVVQPWDEVDWSGQYSSIPIIVYQLARRLSRSHEVVIYAKRGRSQPENERDPNGIEFRRLEVDIEENLLKLLRVAYRPFESRRSNRPYYSRQWYYFGYFLKVANDLRNQRCDIVHIINFSQLVPLVRSLNPNVKIVLHMECEWLTQLDRELIGPRLEKADTIIGCSHFVTDRIRNQFPALASRCETLHNGVDPDKFSVDIIGPDSPVRNGSRLLYIGRISPEKGLHVLLEAFAMVAQHNPGIQLDLIGGTGAAPVEFTIQVSDDKKTKDLASFYDERQGSGGMGYFSTLNEQLPPSLMDRVTFHGTVEQSELTGYFRRADVFTFPSVWHEPFGIPLLEAMACSVPVVATRSGGMPEIVEDGKTGLIVERGDAHSLAEALLTLLNDDDLRTSMGAAGRDRVLDYFTWNALADRLLHLYQRVTDKTTKSSPEGD